MSNTNQERFNEISKKIEERKEKLSNLNADYRYKSAELKEKAEELAELGIPTTRIATLKEYVTEKENRLNTLLANLEQALGIEEQPTPTADASSFLDSLEDSM